MSSIHVMSAPHADRVSGASWVTPTSACAATVHAATAMWAKQLPLAPNAVAAVKANRKGAPGAPGLWDPV